MKNWRVQSDDRGAFDELVVSDTKNRNVIHAEVMTESCLFVVVPGWRIFVNRTRKGWTTTMEPDR